MEAPRRAEKERKTITALFADIKGSVELMEGLDPEEARGFATVNRKRIPKSSCGLGLAEVRASNGVTALER
jgi:hypothetical protein